MKQHRILLRYSAGEYQLSPTAQRMLKKIHTADFTIEHVAVLLGYMCAEFYHNGASPSTCNRWLGTTLYHIAADHGVDDTERIDELVKANSVDLFI